MRSIRFLLAFFLIVIMIAIACTAILLVFEQMGAFTHYAGPDETTVNDIYTNLQSAVTLFAGITLVGGFIYFLVSDEPEQPRHNQIIIGGESYEY